MACSLDLRQRVLDAVRKGVQHKEEIAARFVVSVSSINRWLKRVHLEASKPGPHTAHKLDRNHLQALVAEEPDLYLDEYAEKLGSKRSTVAYNLQVLKISRKKNHAVRRAKRRSTQPV
jgi:transposase